MVGKRKTIIRYWDLLNGWLRSGIGLLFASFGALILFWFESLFLGPNTGMLAYGILVAFWLMRIGIGLCIVGGAVELFRKR